MQLYILKNLKQNTMPIPTPKKNEKQNEFIQRCMSNNVMVKEYPNVNQRLAVCAVQFRKKQ